MQEAVYFNCAIVVMYYQFLVARLLQSALHPTRINKETAVTNL